MKKLIYSACILGVMLFTSCTEDRGTTTEKADANADEQVNPNHINDYDQPGSAKSTASSDYIDASYQRHATMTKEGNKQLREATATQLVEMYYRNDLKPGEGKPDTTTRPTQQPGGRTNEVKKSGKSETTEGTTTKSNSASGQSSGQNNTTSSKEAATKKQ